MSKEEFKLVYRWLRMISSAKMIGAHGHYTDIIEKYSVSMSFLRQLRDLRDPPKRLVYGKYTTKYIDAQNQAVAWEAYGERLVGA